MNITKSESVATTRTGWYLGIVFGLNFLITRFTRWNYNPQDLEDSAIVAAVATVLYRAALFLSSKHAWIGNIFFGISSPPAYEPPVDPLPADVVLPPERDRGQSTGGWLIIGLIIIVALIIIFGRP